MQPDPGNTAALPPARRNARRVAGQSTAAARPNTGRASGTTLDWIVKYAVPLVGVIGAALYGVLRLAYLFFYLHLRATPEEVGYGYSEVLASQLIGAIELVVIVVAVVFVMGLAPRAITSFVGLLARPRSRARTSRDRSTTYSKRVLTRSAVRSAAVAVAVVLVGLPALAWEEGDLAADGRAVRNVYVLRAIRLPVLAVEAIPANVDWVPSQLSGRNDLADRQCLLYLGRSGGISVFYDVDTHESLHLPSDLIIVSLQNTVTVPHGC